MKPLKSLHFEDKNRFTMCRKMKILFLLSFAFILTNNQFLHAQADCCESSGILSSPLDDYGFSSKVIGGDTYIVGWSTDSNVTFPIITRVDGFGNIVWQYTSDMQGQIFDLVESDSDGIFFVGRTAPLQVGPSWQDNKTIIGHIKLDGTVDFVNTYDNMGRESIIDIIKHPTPLNPAAPYYFVSFHNPDNNSPSAVDNAVLNNMDENGNLVWSTEFKFENDDQYGFSIMPYTVDGSVIAVGSSFPTERGVIVKYDGATGALIKGVHASTALEESIYRGVAETDDGNIIVIGNEILANGTMNGIGCLFNGDLEQLSAIRFTDIQSNSFNSINFSSASNSAVVGFRDAAGIAQFTKLQATGNIFETGTFGGQIDGLKPMVYGPRIGGSINQFVSLGSFDAGTTGLDLQYGKYNIDLKIPCLNNELPSNFEIFDDYPHVEFDSEEQTYNAPSPANDYILVLGNLTSRSACDGEIEICDNGIDDDGDGLIDCDDPELATDCCCMDSGEGDLEATICPGVPIVINGQAYAAAGIFQQTLTTPAGCDSLLNVVIIEGTSIEIFEDFTLCPNESIIVNGETITQAGSYQQLLPSAMGCDTIYTFNVDTFGPATGSENLSLCPGASIVVNGQAYNAPGTYTQNLTASTGCDSTVTLFIVAGTAIQISDSFTICQGEEIVIAGQAYNATGNYTANLPAAMGCDTLLQFSLEVLPSMSTLENYSFCSGGSVEVNGQIYDTAGTFVQMINPNSPCPTELTLIIEEIVADDVTENYTICAGEIIVVNNQAYNAAGTYEVMVDNGNGCISTLTIIITEEGGGSTTETYSICPGELIVVGNQAYNAPGTYTQTIPTNDDCDSILNIIITELPMVEATDSFTLCAGELLVVNNQAYNQGGTFTTLISSTTGCDTLLTFTIELLIGTTTEENYYIESGEIIVVNNQSYNAPGQYTQIIPNPNGCDTTLIININELVVGATYDMEDCNALLETGNNSYTEFTATQGGVSCGTLVAGNLYRDNPDMNLHSCTEDANGGIAICVSSLDDCTYDKNAEEKVKIDLMLAPAAGSAMTLYGIRFDQNAPPMFDWIMGQDGENNYPTLYGIRVLLNGTEVFFQDGLITTQVWSTAEHIFNEQSPLAVTTASEFTIELMAYCLIGNTSTVSAWDLDNVIILVGCGPAPSGSRLIAGKITGTTGDVIEKVDLQLTSYEEPLESLKINEEGRYAFPNGQLGKSYELTPTKNDDVLNGVTTLDILQIQRHILGQTVFEDAAKLRAGDVNADHKISALDMIHIRRVILGSVDEFPSKDSWEFLDRKYPLTKDDVYIIPTRIELKELSGHEMHNNFRAIKVGDVTGTTNGAIVARSAETVQLNAVSTEIEGQSYLQIFTTSDLDLAGFQIGLTLENSNILSISSEPLGLTEAHYSTDGQTAKISWNASKPVQISADLPLITIAVDQASKVELSKLSLSNEMYLGTELEVSDVELTSQDIASLDGNNSLSVYPNPSNESFTIHATSKSASLGEVIIYDLSGKLVYSKYVNLEGGPWSQSFGSESLGMSAGVYFIELKTAEETQTIKMVIK